ncbi:hypothetical protein D1AOALGA4SA_9169 [Olavius algarvensis Delta 1 endosymbiont]|nr:hypothetical protein D1AOALGA4SA_9169 [Olavius algarvensis Delta 1 endosymbiont]
MGRWAGGPVEPVDRYARVAVYRFKLETNELTGNGKTGLSG